MNLSPNAITILEKRYLRKENDQPIETPEDLFRRVANAIASAEKSFNTEIEQETIDNIADIFYRLMANLDFMPNSPTLMNAGRELGQLAACFVLPVGDSMEEIFTAVKHSALIHKSGGGTGFSFSKIRPKNDPVRSTGGVASGPVSFMKVFNAATEAIKQGGTRRGANMGILRVDHPDILEFVTSKQDNDELTNFNISVGLTKEFMEAAKSNAQYNLTFNGEIYDQISASELFDLIVEHAWNNGEPGIIFLDRLNENNPTPALGEIEATNPCGEQPLLGYEACNLGSINLAHMVTGKKTVDWDKLDETVKWSIRFLDNVIEVSKYPIPEIETMVRGNRKIGLGIMGWADMLFKLMIPYNSEEAINLADQVMSFIQEKAHYYSGELALERGSFPNIDQSIYKGQAMRNATCTTIAPTGTISMIAGASSGIEPVFSLAYAKHVLDGETLVEINPVFKEYLDTLSPAERSTVINHVVEKGNLQNLKGIPELWKKVFVTALEISPEYHIKMQAAFQKHCDNAVSKTVNFPYTATKEDVRQVYELAYRLGCKGVTVYRSGSRTNEVLTVGKGEAKKELPMEKIYPRSRPKQTIGITDQVKTGCGKMYITVNSDQQGLIETFITTGSTGGCSGFTEGVSRLISLALRANIAPEAIIDQLTSVSCPNFIRRKATDKTIVGKSCPDIIGRILYQQLQANEGLPEDVKALLQAGWEEQCATQETGCIVEMTEEEYLRIGICPECKAKLQFAEGCLSCHCGYSKCG
ncbi:MAG: vitamin B12-dependent ribonucleotide reductase [Clostridia bacterium]|nr:vitamin B12-dependent ribonucleotide reductase [Clostridia bacterium]